MAHITKGRPWLLAIPVAGILIGLLWLAFEPIFGVLSLLWLPAVIAVGIGAAMWKWGAERVLNLLGNKLVRGLAIFALLLALYVYLAQLGYGSLDFFAEFMGVTKLVAAVIILTVALLLTPLPAVIITLFKPTGIPIEEKFVVQGSRALAAIILTILLIRGVNVERWDEDIASGFQTAKAMVAPATARAAPASTTQVIEVGAEWVRVTFPYYHTQQYSPARTIEIRLSNGRILEKTPTGELYEKGGPLPGTVLIPGTSVELRSKDKTANRVVVTNTPDPGRS